MSVHDDTCGWCRGYSEQTEFLQGKTIDEARQTLDARRATLQDEPYNQGGNAATADHIEQELQAE